MTQRAETVFASFRFATAGLRYLLVTQRNARVQTGAGLAAIALAAIVRISRVEWAILTLTIALVLILEALNSAIEATVDLVTSEYHPLAKIAKDVGGGGGLVDGPHLRGDRRDHLRPAADRPAAGGAMSQAAGGGAPRILFLTPQLPSPTRQGAAIRNWNLMVQLAKTHELDLLTFSEPGDEYAGRERQGVDSVPWRRIAQIAAPRRTKGRRLRALLASRQPDMADRLWSPALLRQLAALLSSERYEIIQAEGIELARYLLLVARYRLPDYNPLLIFDEHNAEWVLQRRAALTDLRHLRRLPAGVYSTIQQGRLRRFEARAMRTADLTLCVSTTDARALQPLAPDRPLVVAPNGVDLDYYSTAGIPRERPRFDVIFSGTFDYRPNIDAALWLADEIWPILKRAQDPRRERPLRLALIGRNPAQEITRLAARGGITVTGSVADDRPLLRRRDGLCPADALRRRIATQAAQRAGDGLRGRLHRRRCRGGRSAPRGASADRRRPGRIRRRGRALARRPGAARPPRRGGPGIHARPLRLGGNRRADRRRLRGRVRTARRPARRADPGGARARGRQRNLRTAGRAKATAGASVTAHVPRISLVATILNEAVTIEDLLASIAAQTRQPDEIVIVDGGSTDGTPAILARWAARLPLRVVSQVGANISAGRNAGIAAARGEIIAVTDAGVRLEPDWLAHLVAPFAAGDDAPAIVAGFFAPDPRTPFERAMGATVLPTLADLDPATFLPSSRSIAFRKSAWGRVGGYPEWLDYCEDLIFDLALRDAAVPLVFVPAAIARFRPRGTPRAFWHQYFRYARGDGKAGLFARRHAIRYGTYAGLLAVVLGGRRYPALWSLVVLGGAAYLRRPYRRLAPWLARLGTTERIAAIGFVPAIRLIGDLAKMAGYPVGLVWRWRRYGLRRDWRSIGRDPAAIPPRSRTNADPEREREITPPT